MCKELLSSIDAKRQRRANIFHSFLLEWDELVHILKND